MLQRPTKLALVQTSLFYYPHAKGTLSGPLLFRGLPDSFLQEFTEPKVVMHADEGIPADFPVFQLSNKTGTRQITMTSARVDFRVTLPPGMGGQPPGELFLSGMNLLLILAEVGGLHATRLGAVIQRYSVCERPGIELSQHFCKERYIENHGAMNRPENFELHAHKVFTTRFGVKVNSWMRNKTGKIQETNQMVAAVEQDINTLTPKSQAEAAQLVDTDIITFFSNIMAEFDEALALYYPPVQDDAAGEVI